MIRKEKHIKVRQEVLEHLDEVLSLRKTRQGLSLVSDEGIEKSR
jgi:hypothetical protein